MTFWKQEKKRQTEGLNIRKLSCLTMNAYYYASQLPKLEYSASVPNMRCVLGRCKVDSPELRLRLHLFRVTNQ